MENLIAELKERIIESLNLEEVKPEDIASEGLGLDSIDALELIVMMEKYYGIKLKDASESKAIFQSIGTMAEYIAKNRTK